MALEELLKENNELIREQNGLLAAMLSTTSAGAVAAGQKTTTSSDTTSETTTEAPKRERGKPSPGKARRTSEEVAEDEAADKADAEAGGSTKSDDADGAVTFDVLKKKLSLWLGEFAKEEDAEKPEGAHPEVQARKDAVKAVMNKLTDSDDGKLGQLADSPEKLVKLDNWFETKAKVVDKGFGIGRLAADPEEKSEEEEDELDI